MDGHGGSSEHLVQTKLGIPPTRGDLVVRQRLLAGLRVSVGSSPLTLLSAPAGFGKTTLLAALPSTLPDLTLTWLTVDEGDNDPALFLTYLIGALRRLNPTGDGTAQALLARSHDPGAQALSVVGAFINDILDSLPGPFLLVLDDLHLITQPVVCAALEYLLERLPPQMHLLVGTRHDPPLALARLRARGQLAELRAPDLRFTLDETTTFLNDHLRLDLLADDIAALHAHAEGWPAGLRLLALSLSRIPAASGRTAFVKHLAQTDRYVFDFLAEEVLNRQDRATRSFLLETSILGELTPSLCQAVTGRSDTQAILEDLDRRNLFVTALDRAHAVFRYHALFAEFLRQRLQQEMPERVAELHCRAAQAQAIPAHTINHYLAAQMWEPAAAAIEQESVQGLQRGLLATLSGWIQALPATVLDAHPNLTWSLGQCALLKGEIEAARSRLERVLMSFEAAGDQMREGAALADLAASAFLQADFERASMLIERALGRPVPRHSLVQLLMGRAWLGMFQGDWARVEADFAAALALAEKSAEPPVLLMFALHLKPDFVVIPQGLEGMERFCRHAAAQPGDQNERGPLRLAVEELMVFIHLWRGRLAEAVQAGERALAMKAQMDDLPLLGGDAVAHLGVVHAARGDYTTAERYFDLLLRHIEQVPVDQAWKAVALYLAGRSRWLQGRLEEARQFYAGMCAARREQESPLAPALRARMRGILEMADRRFGHAERSLREAAALEQQVPNVVAAGSAHLLLAHLYLAWNRPEDALAELEPVLAECERQGTPGLILQDGAAVVPVLRLARERGIHPAFTASLLDVLGASGEPAPLCIAEAGETLTPREAEILQFIADGASNRAIAESLVVSLHTVKTHVSSIIQKLGVSSRGQAAARFRDRRV